VSFCRLEFLFLLASFLLTHAKSLPFSFLRSDNENPKKYAATAPSVEATAADEPSLQEAALVAKPSKAPVKKVVSTRGSKRLKKSTDAGASLDTHRPMSSSDDVRVDPGFCCFCSLRDRHTHMFFYTDLDEEVRHFGH
jgi:hypothetical protein